MKKLIKKIFRRLYHLFDDASSLKELKSDERKIILKIKRKRLTYLSNSRLVHIVRRSKQLEHNSVKGIFMEAGCALGGSSILISLIKNPTRSLKVYDVFGMIPPPTNQDPVEVHERYQHISSGKSGGIGGDAYYGYEKDLYDKVLNNFSAFGVDPVYNNVELIKGLVQDTLLINEPVALAHIDVDWYEPVKICLERIFPNLSLGGYIILDDYYDWGGCKKATDEYLKKITGEYELGDKYGSLSIKRISF